MSKFVKGFERHRNEPVRKGERKKEDYPLNNLVSSRGLTLYSEMPEQLYVRKPKDSTFTPSGEVPDHGG